MDIRDHPMNNATTYKKLLFFALKIEYMLFFILIYYKVRQPKDYNNVSNFSVRKMQ